MKTPSFFLALLSGAVLCGFVHGQQPQIDESARTPGCGDGKPPKPRDERKRQTFGGLISRLEELLDAQEKVREDTKVLDQAIQKNPGNMPRLPERIVGLTLAAREKQMHDACAKIITDLKAEGSAVAFIEMLQWVRKDLKRLENRLDRYDVGEDTREIGYEIESRLKEMIYALK